MPINGYTIQTPVVINKDALFNDRYFDKEVILPKETKGECLNYKTCKNIYVRLGNGYCMQCWDRGLDKRGRRRQIIDRQG